MSQIQSSKILNTTRGSCHARSGTILTEIRSPCDSYSHKWGLLQGWSGSRPAERFFGAFFAIRLIGRSCREEGAVAQKCSNVTHQFMATGIV
ncbi:unnamed protein product [Brugia pahangi]|uniref:Uncharacterized protein n=1 Tax=Brugia pahangi TaxID=6280 RepID=A0A0N4SZS3_BRUPA|nr:unnamed protein product [Brugia pahangi]